MYRTLFGIFALLICQQLLAVSAGPSACDLQSHDCFLNAPNVRKSPYNFTEPELRELCRSVETTAKCYVNVSQSCAPEQHQKLANKIQNLLALFSMCDQPQLYEKYRVLGICSNTLDVASRDRSNSAALAFDGCINNAYTYAKTVAAMFITRASTRGRPFTVEELIPEYVAAYEDKLCCLTNKFAQCVQDFVRSQCTEEALAISQTIDRALSGALYCSQTADSCTA